MSLVLLKKLRRDIWDRKGSILALIVIMTIGIGCYVSMAGVYRDLSSSRDRYYIEYRLADFIVNMKRAPEQSLREVSALPNVRSVRGRVSIGVLLDVPGKKEPISGTAISMPEDRAPVLNDLLMRTGSWFSGHRDREVILNHDFAKANGLRPGSRIKALLLDKQHDLLVVGTAMSPEFVSLIPQGGGFAPDPERFGVIYLPEEFLRESCDLDGAYNQIIGLARDHSRSALMNTLELIEEALDRYGVTSATPVQDHVPVRYIDDEIRGIRVSARVMPTIFLVVAALVLNVLINRMVAQQRSIIGTMRALGYTRGAVTRHYLGYGLFIGVLGGLGGAVFGYILQRLLVILYRRFFTLPAISAHFYSDIIFMGFFISIGFAVAGTLKGVRFAARLEPAAAMRPPPPERGGRVLPELLPLFWNPLPFRWKMILRSIFRNPFRSMVSILASTISTALILSALSNVDALNYLMSYEFEKVFHQDIMVTLRDPEGIRVAMEIEDMPGISGAEAQLAVPCDLQNGPYKKRMGVTGLVRDNQLNTPLDKDGKPIVIPESGLVLSKKLGEILCLRPGDKVQLRPLIGRREEVTAPVVALVDTYLGLSAYADIRYMSRLLGESWSANVVLGKSFTPSRTGDLYTELKQRPTVVGITERMRAFTQLQENFGNVMGTMITTMVLFAGLIAFGSILNTALVSLSERQREVGTLRVLGYSPLQVTGIFSGESQLLSSVGIVTGLVAGIGLSRFLSKAYSTELYRFPSVIYPSRMIVTAILMFVFISLAQLIIYRMICKLQWLEVLKVKE